MNRTIRPRPGDLEAATRPHPFTPSGEYAVAPNRVEVCDLCGLSARGPRTIHADHSRDVIRPYYGPGPAPEHYGD